MNPTNTNNHAGSPTSFINAANQSITVNGVPFAYRDIGPTIGVPLVLFNHWGAVLDNFDPAIIDGLAQTRRVMTTDYRGIGGSGGTAPITVGEMADDAIKLIRAGFQDRRCARFFTGRFRCSRHRPESARIGAPLDSHRHRTGRRHRYRQGRRGHVAIDAQRLTDLARSQVLPVLYFDAQRPSSRLEYLQRLKARKKNRDKGPTPSAFLRQLKAITAWGKHAPQNLERLRMPTLIVNGDNDIMVPSVNSIALANRIPNAQLMIYEDAGHGSIFQHYIDFVAKAQAFLDA